MQAFFRQRLVQKLKPGRLSTGHALDHTPGHMLLFDCQIDTSRQQHSQSLLEIGNRDLVQGSILIELFRIGISPYDGQPVRP